LHLPGTQRGVINPMPAMARKWVSWEALPAWRDNLRRAGQSLVVTNGCFDLLHVGHVRYLEAARNLGDALLVGLNSDASVRALKGEGRPLNSEADRATVLAALEAVSAVCIFSDLRATRFLELAQPTIYAKGGDYTEETLNPEERAVVQRGGGRIVILPMEAGHSTTGLLRKLREL
jgi:rfaE bifunctional protein nucleotidyltransferase chain/domain